MAEQYTDYEQVPWHRRSGIVNGFVLVGFFGFAPLLWPEGILLVLAAPALWIACFICLTGDIYTHELDKDGYLAKCTSTTRTAALVCLGVQAIGFTYLIVVRVLNEAAKG